MSRRKLCVALVVAGLISVGLGWSVLSVSAQTPPPNGNSVNLTLPGVPCVNLGLVSVSCPPPPGAPPPAAPPAPQAAPPATPEAAKPPTEAPPSRQQIGAAKEHAKAQPKGTAGPTLGKPHSDDVKPQRGANGQPRAQDGQPTVDNPTFSFAQVGAAPLGVPNFFIEKFRIPPFLLPIYQAAGTEYGVPWQVLAAINEIETDYGRNLSVSSAGALGWMQFIPSSWQTYGVDANGDGKKDPYNPVDAIFAAARYLRAAGGDQDLHKAIFAYNHADWYVQSVLVRAKLIGGMPADLVGSLTGLTQGHFPVAATATYADDLNEKRATGRVHSGNAAVAVNPKAGRREVNIFARAGAPVIAVNDGVIREVGKDRARGRFVVLQDVYGNSYTYSHLGQVAPSFPAPRQEQVQPTAKQLKSDLELPPKDAAPTQAATGGKQAKPAAKTSSSSPSSSSTGARPARAAAAAASASKERLFAHPGRSSAYGAGGDQQLLGSGRPVAGYDTFDSYVGKVLGLRRADVTFKALKPGAQVIAGTIVGRIDRTDQQLAPHVTFSLRPTGRGAPQVDPKPILDGWKLLEATAVYRASAKNPFWGRDAKNPSVGQILLMSKAQLEKRVLADPRIEIYDCGRNDIQAHIIDHRVLAALEFLAASGLRPYVSTLKCGHSYFTTGGTVSEHTYGDAVDIAKINGIPIVGHQGPGSITDITNRRIMTLQGTMQPNQLISLMTYTGVPYAWAQGDHADHIHIGWPPLFGDNAKLRQHYNSVLKPKQWVKLIDRLNQIDEPVVPTKPSKYALTAGK
jgi:soluble lytic murein transglycosylase-like protein